MSGARVRYSLNGHPLPAGVERAVSSFALAMAARHPGARVVLDVQPYGRAVGAIQPTAVATVTLEVPTPTGTDTGSAWNIFAVPAGFEGAVHDVLRSLRAFVYGSVQFGHRAAVLDPDRRTLPLADPEE